MSPAILSAEYVIMAAMSGYRLRDAWPWRRFTLETTLPPAEAAAALAGQIGPGSAFRGARTGPLQFRISRVIAYRNSFLPVVGVTIEPRPSGGARVLVTMRMMAPVIVFMAFWMTGATGAALFGVTLLTRGSPAGLAALLFPLFGAALAGGGFSYEARRAQQLLRDLFPAPPEGDSPYR